MGKSIAETIAELSHEDFQTLVDSIPENELEHWGVLGMKWGVRTDRRTGKRQGKPVKGTEAAKHDTPSVSPGSEPKSRKTASPDGETSIPARNNRRVSVTLDQRQKSKLGSEGLDIDDLSIPQLKSVAERMRLESEISKMLDGPTKTEAMQAVVNRIKLEQEYARLTAAPPSLKKRLLKKTGTVLASVAETQAKNLLNAVAKSKIDDFLVQNGFKPTQNEKKDDKKKDDKKDDKAADTPKAAAAPKALEAPKSWKPPKAKDRRPN